VSVAEVYTTETANIVNNLWVNDLEVKFLVCANCKVNPPNPITYGCQPLKFCIYCDFYSDLTLMFCTFFGCAHANRPSHKYHVSWYFYALLV